MPDQNRAGGGEFWAGIALVVVSVGVGVLLVITAVNRELSSLEGALFQVLGLGAGLLGSYVLGRRSASVAAREMVKPHARSAFRRVLSLYSGLSRLAQIIERVRAEPDQQPALAALDTLEAVIIEQIATADDALDDWRDLVPEDVEEVERKLRNRQPPAVKGLVQ